LRLRRIPGKEAEPETSAADEDALVARIIEAFDAEELPADASEGGEARP